MPSNVAAVRPAMASEARRSGSLSRCGETAVWSHQPRLAFGLKDRLLQQNGYLCCASSPKNVGKNLEMVLDTIKRTLFGRQKR